jgi:APA family basic amino acid/polyamine antiporter
MFKATDKPQTIGIWITTAIVVGTIIGSGIFMLPVSLAPLGRNVLIGWLVSGVGVLCIVFALAQLSRLSGDGIQANIERELSPTIAFLVAWAFWVSNWVGQASVAVAAASALSFAGLRFGGPDMIVTMSIGWVVVLTAVNAMGVRAAGGLSLVTVAIKLLPLFAVIWLFLERSASGASYEPLPAMPITIANVAAATALTFWAFTGFEGATTPVGKVRNPGRTIPRALLGGTAFADALASRWGTGAATFAALAIAIAAIGCLNGLILATGELGYAMALRGDLPTIMTRTRGVDTPIIAQVVGSGLTVLLLLANSSRATASLFTFTILLSAAAVVVVYFTSAIVAWKLSTEPVARGIIATGVLFLAFATYGIGLEAVLWCLVLLAIGMAIRTAMRRLSPRTEIIRPAADTAA